MTRRERIAERLLRAAYQWGKHPETFSVTQETLDMWLRVADEVIAMQDAFVASLIVEGKHDAVDAVDAVAPVGPNGPVRWEGIER